MDNWRTYPQEAPTEFEYITFYSHTLSFYFTGSYSGFKRGTSGSVGEVWSGQSVRRIRTGDLWKYDEQLPPPHSPTHPNDTPLVETATADNGDEITEEKMRNEDGWRTGYQNIYEIAFIHDCGLAVCLDFHNLYVAMNAFTLSIKTREFNITTMTELRTLIRWLS